MIMVIISSVLSVEGLLSFIAVHSSFLQICLPLHLPCLLTSFLLSCTISFPCQAPPSSPYQAWSECRKRPLDPTSYGSGGAWGSLTPSTHLASLAHTNHPKRQGLASGHTISTV